MKTCEASRIRARRGPNTPSALHCPRRAAPILAVILAALLGFPGSILAADAASYRLVRGSTLIDEPTAAGPPQPAITSPLTGSFRLVRQISPLDWRNYTVENLRLVAGQRPADQTVLHGQGFYREGGRFTDTRRLTLELEVDGQRLTLDSGEVAGQETGPGIDLLLKQTGGGDARHRYSLRLSALPVLRLWHYRLVEGSTFLDDCPVCGRPSILRPLRGGFDLAMVDENPLFSRYHLFDVDLQTTDGYALEGEGDFEIGGEVALVQRWNLDVTARIPEAPDNPTGFTNASLTVTRPWPMLAVDLDQTNGTITSTLRVELRAAPFRELWFSTVHGLTPGNGPPLPPRVSAGDLLSLDGRVVRGNAELVQPLGLDPDPTGLGIDALDIAPGGEVWFSLNEDAKSASLGPLSAGDLLSDAGRVVRRGPDLVRAFGFMPPTPDLGLDALQVLDDGELLFSTTQDAFSEKLGITIQHGDLLSAKGEVRHSNKALLAAFQPDDPGRDLGLDAIHVWPSGEVWFSTEEGFQDKQWGPVMDGDLLSTAGYVVFRNLEFVGRFSPLEDLANFGLDGLFVVTDLATPLPAPVLTLTSTDSGWRVAWEGKGRVSQVESAVQVQEPFTPASEILPGTYWDVAPSPGGTPAAFFGLRQW